MAIQTNSSNRTLLKGFQYSGELKPFYLIHSLGTLTGTTTPAQRGPSSNGNKKKY